MCEDMKDVIHLMPGSVVSPAGIRLPDSCRVPNSEVAGVMLAGPRRIRLESLHGAYQVVGEMRWSHVERVMVGKSVHGAQLLLFMSGVHGPLMEVLVLRAEALTANSQLLSAVRAELRRLVGAGTVVLGAEVEPLLTGDARVVR